MITSLIERIKSGKYNFKSTKEKLDILDHAYEYGLTIKEQLRIIETLPKSKKEEAISNILNYQTMHDITDSELEILFRSLPYQDRVKALKLTKERYTRKKLLDMMSASDIVATIRNYDMPDEITSYAISLLPLNKRINLYKYRLLKNSDDTCKLLEQLPVSYVRKFLKGNDSALKMNPHKYVKLLDNDEEKLEYLDDDNKYGLKITLESEKIEVLSSMSDEYIFKILKDELDLPFDLSEYRKREMVSSLSDEGKMRFLLEEKELYDKLFHFYNTDDLFKTFTPSYARKLLSEYNDRKYSNSNALKILIDRLTPEEKLEYLHPTNKNGIEVTEEVKEHIIRHLPIKYKKEVLRTINEYGITLSQPALASIIKSMDPLNIINILVFDEDEKYSLPKENIWEIIESLEAKQVTKLLKIDNEKVKKFICKYRTSFAKRMHRDDKIDILLNKSEYGITLDDDRKIKLLRTIRFLNEPELDSNIFDYFDNIDKVLDFYLEDPKEFCKIDEFFQKQLIKKCMNKEISEEERELCISIIKYTTDPKKILTRFDEFKSMFTYLGIDMFDFLQYGLNATEYDWVKNTVNILTNSKLEEFSQVKDYFFEYYYDDKTNKKNRIKNFLELLYTYSNYPIFCTNLAKSKKSLTKEEKEDISFLTQTKDLTEIYKLEDIKRKREEEIQRYRNDAKFSNNASSLKDSILRLLFSRNSYNIEKLIKYTGTTEDIRILRFNNRNKPYLNDFFDTVELMTEFIELITASNDVEGLKKILKGLTDENNIEETKNLISFFRNYEEYVRKLFELDLKTTLTKISSLDSSYSKTPKARELSFKYGGKVIDLSDSKYCLAAHVMSSKETIDEILYGKCDGKSNYICMSPTSHRGEHYYYGNIDNKVVFAYDDILDDSFICSSISNMGSNYSLKYNTVEVPEITRTQKGVLETSEAISGNNSEILLYRENLRPCGIIIPKSSKLSSEAIKYHKEYDLPLIITQEIDTTIENPKDIEEVHEVVNIRPIKETSKLKEMVNFIKKSKSPKKKTFAVLADIHALYEPTLACLTDISKKGITEIYSIGDNIGHGPSPREVIELLDTYNVKSIYGNHEIYLVNEDGIDQLIEHFPSAESITRTRAMNNWIRSTLTYSQLEDIKNYPERIDIPLPNGKDITLIHTDEAYSKEGRFSNTPDLSNSELILKGHKHFEEGGYNNRVLRAVGIGQTTNDDGLAVYYQVEIDEEGKYEVTPIKIKYDRTNLQHTINESNMPSEAKYLIKKWVGQDKKKNS